MPKRKSEKAKRAEEDNEGEPNLPRAAVEDDNDAQDEQDEGKGDKAKAKKTKTEKDANGKIELGKMKLVDVREFKGMTLVDIREYYEDKNSGEMKPGKKGISLQAAQWEALKENMDKIDAKIEELQG